MVEKNTRQAVSDYVRHTMEQMAMELPDGRPSVRTVANVAMQINYFNKDMLLAGMVSVFLFGSSSRL